MVHVAHDAGGGKVERAIELSSRVNFSFLKTPHQPVLLLHQKKVANQSWHTSLAVPSFSGRTGEVDNSGKNEQMARLSLSPKEEGFTVFGVVWQVHWL